MAMLQSFIVDALRQGLPITGAVLGAVMAGRRKSAPELSSIALYSMGGWAAGYGIRVLVLDKLALLFHRPLPQNVAALRGLNSMAPGQVSPSNRPAPSVQGPPPQAPTPLQPIVSSQPDMSGNSGGDVKVKGTMFMDALGAL